MFGAAAGDIAPVGDGESTVQARDHVAVVIPAFNEAEGLAAFLAEITSSFAEYDVSGILIVVDDASTDDTSVVAKAHADVIRATANRGHGPTALAAYDAGLRSGAQVIVHVDGDGQFYGRDIARVAAALHTTDAEVVHGVRRGRTDPWFRRALSASVRVAVLVLCGRSVPDVNTPLRAYRPDALRRLLTEVPGTALVPHVHFSIAEARHGLRVRYVSVSSIPRRGGAAQGTMWGAGRTRIFLPPRRLMRFARLALVELWRVDIIGVRGRERQPDRHSATVQG